MLKIFDAHLHIIDPGFPLVENQGFLPEPFTCRDYLKRTEKLNIIGGAVVSGSFQAFDQTYLIDALKKLGQSFVGITQLPYTTPDEEILHLNRLGVRGVRFNIRRGGSETIAHLESFAQRIYDLAGWRTELYIDSGSLPEIAGLLARLPAVSIDHLGLSKSGFKTLLSLAEKGVRVKATGFGRVTLNVEQALHSITSANPDALMFGTDLPSTRAKRPFEAADIDIVRHTLEDALAEKVLYRNALEWYTPAET